MARAKRKQQRKGDSWGTEFCEIPIPASDKKAAKDWCADVTDNLAQILPEFLSDGYKFGVRWDENNETNIVSMTCVAEGHPNQGKCIVSRSDDWVEAICLCLYKSRVICGDGKWPDSSDKDTWG